MFCIKIADIVIGIDNRYPRLQRYCHAYIVEGETPAFTVSASEEEVARQMTESSLGAEECEGLCVYRKIALELIRYDAFLMHCAVIAVDGDGFAFAAKSGTGKTTHLKLWRKAFRKRAVVVNGDKPILRFIGDTLYACGTPWKGKECIGGNTRAPLKVVYFLERGDENHVRPMSNAEVLSRIFHQLLMPEDPVLMDHFLTLVDRMLAQTEFYLLTCNMKPEAALVAYARGKSGDADNAENKKGIYPQKNGFRIHGYRHWFCRRQLQRHDSDE